MSESLIKPAEYLFYDRPSTTDEIMSPELQEDCFKQTFPYGVMEYREWRFDGILIRYKKTTFNGVYFFENKNLLNGVSLEFNLRGEYEIHHVRQVYRVKSRQHNIIYSPGVHNTFRNQDLYGESFKIYFLPEVFLRITRDSNESLKRFAVKITEGKPAVMAQVSPLINPELSRAIYDIINCRFTGGLRKVFLLSKCMEILVMQAEAFNETEYPDDKRRKTNDRDRLYDARDYLTQNLDNPPSLSDLSKIIGINEYKLKRGFKQLFHTTVFGFLSSYRLEQARKALLEDNRNISEIAYSLGYSSPQHFSAAFRKRFGLSPKAARQRRHS